MFQQRPEFFRNEIKGTLSKPRRRRKRELHLSLVLICRRHTWDVAAGTVWDTVTAYVNIYRRIIIYPRHRPPACLQSWAEFKFAGKPAVVGDENILCEHHLQAQRTPVRRLNPHLQVKWLKIAQFDLHFAQIWVRQRSIADAPGTHVWDPLAYCTDILTYGWKFELTNQDSAGGKNFTALTSSYKAGKALKSGNFSHWKWL